MGWVHSGDGSAGGFSSEFEVEVSTVANMIIRIFSRSLSKAGIFHLFSPFKKQG